MAPVEDNAAIALHLKRLQWGLVLAVVLWLLIALGPILTVRDGRAAGLAV